MCKDVENKQLARILESIDDNNSDSLKKELSKKVEEIFLKDQSYFFQILYRIDVDEEKVNQALSTNHSNPYDIIAELIIKRQIQKNNSRNNSKEPPDWSFDI